MDEQFADVPGVEGYQVTSLGRVIGPRGKPLAGYRDKNGYHCIPLRSRNITFKVHRAVVAAFLGPIPEGMQVNHKNGVKDDNRLENLEVVTAKQNIQHTFSTLGRVGKNTKPAKGANHPKAKLTEDEVREIRRLYSEGHTQTALAARYGIAQVNISQIVLRKHWKHVV